MIVSTLFSHSVFKVVAVAASTTVGVVVSPMLVTAGLGAVGFSAAGPVAGRFLYQGTSDAMRHITSPDN